MSREKKYIFDNDDFRVRKDEKKVLTFLKAFAVLLVASLSLTVVYYFVFSLFFSTDRERRLRNENRMIARLYPEMQAQADLLSDVVSGLRQRDDAIYEDIFKTAAPDVDRLLSVDGEDFMYRDFQARNVMLRDGEPFFIDFQCGRKGPVHYDLASFVWQAKASYPSGLKSEMVSAYLGALSRYRNVDEAVFMEDLRQFALFRLLQVLGAYGFRGLYGKKPHFLESIPFAMANLREYFSSGPDDYPYLSSLLKKISVPGTGWSGPCVPGSSPAFAESDRLDVEITSFSYRKGIPDDLSGNGGGYVFDCRSLVNPGRYEKYRGSTGRDADVAAFLEQDGGVSGFLGNVYALVDAHTENFLERGFRHLSVSFGCTGGQHRSVYCAESLARHLASRFGSRLRIILRHREQDILTVIEGDSDYTSGIQPDDKRIQGR